MLFKRLRSKYRGQLYTELFDVLESRAEKLRHEMSTSRDLYGKSTERQLGQYFAVINMQRCIMSNAVKEGIEIKVTQSNAE